MSIARALRSRFQRGFSAWSIGPNEARVLYDGVVGAGAAVLSGAHLWLFAGVVPPVAHLVAPAALLGLNLLFGVYSRLRTSSGRTKAVVLGLSTSLAAATAVLCGDAPALAALWLLIAAPPIVLARALLALPQSRHRTMAVAVVRQRGPVLVIGGAGYIGTHVVDVLLREGRSVRVLDTLMYGESSLTDFRDSTAFEVVTGDVTDIRQLTAAMQGVSAVVHLAGLVGDPACAVDPDFTRHANIVATRMAKDVALSMGVHRFVFASSCSVYGESEKEVREGDRLNPVSLYAQTKVDSEAELLSSARDDFFVTVLRFATVFGHSRRARFDLVANLFTAQAMTEGLITAVGGDQWRPFVHVHDLARAVAAVLRTSPFEVQSQILNVGDARLNMTIQQLAGRVKAVAESFGRKVEVTIGDQAAQDRRNYRVSFAKIASLLDFRAETLLEQGVREMAQHFHDGTYTNYRSDSYSNVAMTRKALSLFNDPMQTLKLYAPLVSRAGKASAG